jgi:orotidine-5'-phosphate decarboxylase
MQKAIGPGCPIIVAMDDMSINEMLIMRNKLCTGSDRFDCALKVEDVLAEYSPCELMRRLGRSAPIMLDLKLHQTPNAARNYCRRIANGIMASQFHAPWIVTVHASGGKDMMVAAVETFAKTPTSVVAITLPTCIDKQTSMRLHRRGPRSQVLTLAHEAINAGADGLVCSPQEVEMLRREFSDTMLVVPGSRSSGEPHRDQRRTGFPQRVLSEGGPNTYLVIGERIVTAKDPHAEVSGILQEL